MKNTSYPDNFWAILVIRPILWAIRKYPGSGGCPPTRLRFFSNQQTYVGRNDQEFENWRVVFELQNFPTKRPLPKINKFYSQVVYKAR